MDAALPLRAPAGERRRSRLAVQRVLADGAIRCLVQPVVRLSDDAVVGYEALARPQDEELELGPQEWLDLADRYDLRCQLELAMLRAAVALGPPPGDVPLFVNASAATLLHADFEAIRATLPRHVLELTEHDPVQDYAQLLPRLAAWRAQGTHVAVDDVGAGYATMAHVLRLDPTYLKIDRSIVAGLDRDPRRRALVAALHTLAAESGARSIAEGVERPQELAALREIGIDAAQGFLLCRPAAAWPELSSRQPEQVVVNLGRAGRLVATAPDARTAAQHVANDLARDAELLPSVYLARNDVLRCVARSGQWLVIDGIPSGIGLTGSAYASGELVLVRDVSTDPRYRQAVPDVVSEIAVPLLADGAVVGVLNVDTLRPITDADVARVAGAGRLLEQRLRVVGTGAETDSPLQRLGRTAPRLAAAESPTDLGIALVESAIALSGFDTACIWSVDAGTSELLAGRGVDTALLTGLSTSELDGLRELVRHTASCYTGGPALDLATGPTDVLRQQGVRAAVIVPVRDAGRLSGFLLLTRRHGARVPQEVVDATELLCLHAGSRLAALRRLDELQRLATRDALTGLANRTRLDALLEGNDVVPDIGWLAVADIDRFKGVNDTFGHAAGDEVLRALAELMRGTSQCAEALRLGGDEFALLLRAGDETEARSACEELHRRARPLLAPYGAGLSVGLAPTSGTAGLRIALLHADDALYRRKGMADGGVALWRPARIKAHSTVPPGERRVGPRSVRR